MADVNKWERYDIAKSQLQLVIGHYSQLIREEESKPSPDFELIRKWEDTQDDLSDMDSLLSADDKEQIEGVIASYGDLVSKIMERS